MANSDVLSGFIQERLVKAGRLVLAPFHLPVSSAALITCGDIDALHETGGLCDMTVPCDFLAIDQQYRHATAVVIGGRSNESSPVVSRSKGALLRASEITMVTAMRRAGFQIDVGVVAVLSLGEATFFQEDLVARWEDIDSLFDLNLEEDLRILTKRLRLRHDQDGTPLKINMPICSSQGSAMIPN